AALVGGAQREDRPRRPREGPAPDARRPVRRPGDGPVGEPGRGHGARRHGPGRRGDRPGHLGGLPGRPHRGAAGADGDPRARGQRRPARGGEAAVTGAGRAPGDHGPAAAAHTSRPHVGARLEDRAYALLARRLARRGWVPRIEPYAGYGAPGWVRVMARAVL